MKRFIPLCLLLQFAALALEGEVRTGEFKLLAHASDGGSVPQVGCDSPTPFWVCYSVNAVPQALLLT